MMGSLGICKPGEVLGPDPSHLLSGIILVFGKPELAFLSHHIKNLAIVSRWKQEYDEKSMDGSPRRLDR